MGEIMHSIFDQIDVDSVDKQRWCGLKISHNLRKRIYGLVLLTGMLALLFVLFIHGPIPQDPKYHNFADQRTILGIPNFWNVFSNILFLLAGLHGIYVLYCGNSDAFQHVTEKGTYCVLFVSVCFIAVGSAYYHLWPDTDTLFWDRLPMTIGFMTIMSILFSEKVDRRLGRKLFIPLIFIGVSSVLWWSFTESHPSKTGDLRPYIIVQFAPVLLTPFIIMIYPNSYTHTTYMYISVALYVVAKVTEVYDQQIYRILYYQLSGHTLKHIIAAYGIFILSRMLQKRRPIKLF